MPVLNARAGETRLPATEAEPTSFRKSRRTVVMNLFSGFVAVFLSVFLRLRGVEILLLVAVVIVDRVL